MFCSKIATSGDIFKSLMLKCFYPFFFSSAVSVVPDCNIAIFPAPVESSNTFNDLRKTPPPLTGRSKCSRSHNSATGDDHFSAISRADDANVGSEQSFKYNYSTVGCLLINGLCCKSNISLADIIQHVSHF